MYESQFLQIGFRCRTIKATLAPRQVPQPLGISIVM